MNVDRQYAYVSEIGPKFDWPDWEPDETMYETPIELEERQILAYRFSPLATITLRIEQ